MDVRFGLFSVFEGLEGVHRKFVVVGALGYLPLLRVVVGEKKYEFKEQILV